MTAITAFADLVADAPRTHSALALDRAATSVLDSAGCMLLGAGEQATQVALDAVGSWGVGASPVIGRDVRLAAPWAALVNGVSAHVFDFDDWDDPANSHPSAVLVPALLALLAEGEHTGPDLLDAYIAGFEIIARMGEAVNMSHYNLGWHSTGTLGALGAAAACARARRLSRAQAANAISLATSMAGGYLSQIGTMAKPLHVGFAAKAGIMAARLAETGATAFAGALDGPVSFAKLLVEPGEARFAPALAKLGRPWAIEEHGLCLKAYPSCSYTHRVIDAAMELHAKLGSNADAIESIEASLPDFHLAILPYKIPEAREQALFSVPYCVALALAQGAVGVSDFSIEALRRPEIIALAAKVTSVPRKAKDPRRNVDPDDPDEVRVRLASGKTLSASVAMPLGSPPKPMSARQVEEKFMACAKGMGSNRAGRLFTLLRELPAARSLAPLLAALADTQMISK